MVPGTLAPFRYLAGAFGLVLAVTAAALSISLILDAFCRYERRATVLAVSGRPAEEQRSRRDGRDGRARVEARATIDVRFTYEAAGKLREGRRHAPVDILLSPEELEAVMKRLQSGQAHAYVSYFDPDNAVLYRALGTRSGAMIVAAIGASLLLAGAVPNDRLPVSAFFTFRSRREWLANFGRLA